MSGLAGVVWLSNSKAALVNKVETIACWRFLKRKEYQLALVMPANGFVAVSARTAKLKVDERHRMSVSASVWKKMKMNDSLDEK